jgi:dienelactone hydrolase
MPPSRSHREFVKVSSFLGSAGNRDGQGLPYPARVIERRPLLRAHVIAWITAGLVVLCSCTSSGKVGSSAQIAPLPSSTSTTTAPRLLPGHTSWVETFVDRSRRTVPSTGAALPSRTLLTAIYRPNGAGPFPLIVFSHGLSGHPDKFTKLFSAWANAGFAVAAPAFPLTNSHASDPNSNISDVGQQPDDVAFVLDNVLALSRRQGSRLSHAIDARRIGASGLSLGGLTTYKLVYGKCCRDLLIDAVAVLDSIRTDDALDGHVPLLIAHSDTDPALPYSSAVEAFAGASAPAWFVTLHGASHASQWEDDTTPFDAVAERITIDFWDATLNGNAQAFARLQTDATVPNLSSIVAKRTTAT